MKHVLNGKRYEVVYVDKVPGDELGLLYGMCDCPDTKQKKIYIRNGLPLSAHIDVLVHEAVHACLWCLSEEAVDVTANDITKMLIKELNITTES